MKVHPLRLERMKRGFSQYHLAFNSGVPQVSISYAERWYPVLKMRQKEKIANFLNMSIEDLFPIVKHRSNHKANEMKSAEN